MAPFKLLISIFSLLLNALLGNAIQYASDTSFLPGFTNVSSPEVLLAAKRDDKKDPDPSDMSWIKRWAAVGDSFTAGIGAGDLYSQGEHTADSSYNCSRYSLTYPSIMQRYIGAGINSFEYKACSGAKTHEIGDQIDSLTDGQDLIMLTAGGNDLCLSSIIGACIMYPWESPKDCREVLADSQARISSILKGKIRELLEKMKLKMNKDGVIIWVLYARYFDLTEEPCATKEDWTFPKTGLWKSYPLTVENRREFNQLVNDTNSAIRNTIEDWRHEENPDFMVNFVDWDPWVVKQKGQYCDPRSSGQYPDPHVSNLHFYKADTSIKPPDDLEIPAKMYTVAEDQVINTNITSRSSLPDVVNLEMEPVHCPADTNSSWLAIPDRWGKFFHPNELGHVTIASFVMEGIISARSKILGVSQPLCKKVETFKCKQAEHLSDRFVWKRWADTYRKFCKSVHDKDEPDWSEQSTYYENTPEEHTYTVTLSDGAKKMSLEDCDRAFKTILDNCAKDGDYLYGGTYQKGGAFYELSVMENGFTRAPNANSMCHYAFKGVKNIHDHPKASVLVRGAGFATYDWGQESMKWAMNRCGCKWYDMPRNRPCDYYTYEHYNFTYVKEPIDGLWEWELTFNERFNTYPKGFDECVAKRYEQRFKHDDVPHKCAKQKKKYWDGD